MMTKNNFFKLFIGLFIFFGFNLQLKAEKIPLPEITGYVTDLGHKFNDAEVNRLSKQLSDVEKETGSQIIVVTIPTVGDDTIENFTIKLAEKTKIGRKNIDDGVIILIATEDRQARIEVGYGLEGVLPDALVSKILNEIVIARLPKGEYFPAMTTAVAALHSAIISENLPKTVEPVEKPISPIAIFIFIFMLVVALLPIARKIKVPIAVIIGALGGAMWHMDFAATGIIVGAFAGLFLSLLGFAGVSGVLGSLLVASMLRGRSSYSSRGGRDGGGFGGGGGGGSGFGGGGFGGGGASGRW